MKERDKFGSRLGFILVSAGVRWTWKCMEVPIHLRTEWRRCVHSDLSGVFDNSWTADSDQ